jgi:hypothetical protein
MTGSGDEAVRILEMYRRSIDAAMSNRDAMVRLYVTTLGVVAAALGAFVEKGIVDADRLRLSALLLAPIALIVAGHHSHQNRVIATLSQHIKTSIQPSLGAMASLVHEGSATRAKYRDIVLLPGSLGTWVMFVGVATFGLWTSWAKHADLPLDTGVVRTLGIVCVGLIVHMLVSEIHYRRTAKPYLIPWLNPKADDAADAVATE